MSKSKQKHTGLERAADKMQDMAGGLVGRAEARSQGAASADDFVANAAIGDMYEIEAAKIAIKQSRSEQIKEVALKMIADHTTNTHQLKSALRTNEAQGVKPPPTGVDERREKMLKHLQEAPADKFDKTYLEQQVMAHKETADLLTGYRDSGDNAQLRSLAAGAAPVVQRHLRHMQALQAELG